MPGRGQVNGHGEPSTVPAPAGRAAMLKQQPSEVRVPAMSEQPGGRPGPGDARSTAASIKVEPGFNKRGTSGER